MSFFNQRNILISVTGGIAAYKIPLLIRELKRLGADVRIVITDAAQQFVTPLTLQALSGHPVHTHLFDETQESAMGHIELSRWADMLIIAPATANCLARLAHGIADDLLTTLCLATRAPIFVAPAMNHLMWIHPATQNNLKILQDRKVHVLPIGYGEQACGDVGEGRMLEPTEIIEHLSVTTKLNGKKILITAGPTREWIDPVRFISNPSTSTMGYALASAARLQGAEVVLISGPTQISAPQGVSMVKVETALEMYETVFQNIVGTHIFISTAAISDYRPIKTAAHKIKKTDSAHFNIECIINPDILKSVSELENRPFCVGFAAETQNITAYALEKLQTKKLDMICVNDISAPGIGFGEGENALKVIMSDKTWNLNRQSKSQLAIHLIELIAEQFISCNTPLK